MRLRRIFVVLGLMFAAACVLAVVYCNALPEPALWGIIAIALACIVLLIIFYQNVFKPIRSIAGGMDLLREQDFSSRLAQVNQKEADEIVDMFNSMMAALKEERLRVREQSHLMDLLVEKSPMGVIMLNGNDIITSTNDAAIEQISCIENILGKRISEIDTPLAKALAELKNGETTTSTLSDSMIYRCSRLTFMDKGYQHPFFIIEPLTREIKEAQKESYGKVIRVISHEVNNSMTAVDSTLTTISDACITDPLLNEAIDVCVQRCRSLSQFITSYANVVKIPQARKQPVSIFGFIESTRVMFESMCRARNCSFAIECEQREGDEFIAEIDSVLMEQALINIVKNSVESIESSCKPGAVKIKIDAKSRTVIIEDNGPGIPDHAAANLFKPFFSTKSNGQGIGLIFIAEALTRNNCAFNLRTCADGLTRFTIIMQS